MSLVQSGVVMRSLAHCLLTAVTAIGINSLPADKVAAQDGSLYFTPRAWYSFVELNGFVRDLNYQESSQLAEVPLLGATLAYTPKGSRQPTYSLTALYGAGSADFRALESFAIPFPQFAAYIGRADIERLDVEGIVQFPMAEGVQLTVGARFVDSRADTRGSRYGNLGAIEAFQFVTSSQLYLAELGFAISQSIDSTGKHRLFGNLTGVAGMMQTDISESVGGVTYLNESRSGGVVGADVNLGYSFQISEGLSASARYRLFMVSGMDFDLRNDTIFVHGPELNLTFKLN